MNKISIYTTVHRLPYLGTIASGIPQFRFPFLDYEDEDEKFTFFEGLSRLWPGAIVVPLVSILSTVSVAKAFSKLIRLSISTVPNVMLRSYWVLTS